MKFPFLLRPDQLKALYELRNNHHLIHIAPTGSGKSVLYQKFIFDHPKTKAVLISPLNALSRQQDERFSSLGIKTFSKNFPDHRDSGVWILSPEKVQGRLFVDLEGWKPDFLIVDEAHCVWEWGKKFRPAYRRIFDLLKIPSVHKSLWCSATFPQSSQIELIDHFKSLNKNKFKALGSFQFPQSIEMRSEKISPEMRLYWLRNKLGEYADQSGMVFCNTRLAAVSIQKYLKMWGIRSFYYHAGLSVEEKLNLENELKLQQDSSDPLVVVATSAFGMGMDYSFFRFCILFEPPYSLLSLVQSIGRIGRASSNLNRPKAKAHVLWHPIDFTRNQTWIDQKKVYEWCRSLENPVLQLENYFNGRPLSGSMNKDECTIYDSYGSTSFD